MTAEQPLVTIIGLSGEAIVAAHATIEGRVAPKPLLKSPDARVMHLAFAPGAELTEHKAPVPIIVQSLAGELAFEVAGESFTLTRGGMAHIAANVPHAVTATAEARLLITLLGGERKSEGA